jgi:hypothetical protein
LREAPFDGLPVGGGDDARDRVDVELEVAFDGGEPDAGPLERAADAVGKLGGVGAGDGLEPGAGVRSRFAGGRERFVEDSLAHRVVGEEVIRAEGGHRRKA